MSRLREDRKAYYKSRIDEAKRPGEVWRITDEIISPRGGGKMVLDMDGSKVEDDREIAEAMNNFFIQKIADLREGIDQSMTEDPLKRLKETIKPNRPTFSFKTVSEARVLKIIRKLSNKNSFGTDGISSKVLKSAADVLAAPITFIVNTSLTSGIYPTRWKTAKVIPILKKGDPTKMANYRPVALLPVTSKILEEVVRGQVSDHFEKNGLLPVSQHGFRPSRSTTTALLSLEKTLIEAQENGKSSAMLLFDLSAAFDTLDHQIFLEKLKIYGVDDLGQRWFQSYLEDREQFVEIGQMRSSTKCVPWGSPQGAVCSPLIFTIFKIFRENAVLQQQKLNSPLIKSKI